MGSWNYRQSGITGNLALQAIWHYRQSLEVVSCNLTQRKQCVAISGRTLWFLLVLSGVPQGNSLGPLLFPYTSMICLYVHFTLCTSHSMYISLYVHLTLCTSHSMYISLYVHLTLCTSHSMYISLYVHLIPWYCSLLMIPSAYNRSTLLQTIYSPADSLHLQCDLNALHARI